VRIITRYILKEIAAPFALGLAVFTLLLLIARILKLVELVVNRGVPLWEVAKVFSYILPAFLEVTVPMALLLAVLVALSRLSSDSEIVAMKAAGVSLAQFTRPVALFALVVYALAVGLSVYGRPWGNRLLRNGLYEIAKVRATAGLKPKVFNDDFSGLLIYVDHIEPPGTLLRGVLISDSRKVGAVGEGPTAGVPAQGNTVVAKMGRLEADENLHVLTLQLSEGSVHSFGEHDRSYRRTDFGTYSITLDLNAVGRIGRERDPSEMSLSELRAEMHGYPGQKILPNVAAAEFQRRFSIPFACLAFAAVAIPFGLRSSTAVRSRSLIVSLALILLYYLSFTLGQSLGERGLMPILPAMWLPNVGLLIVAGFLLRRTAREPSCYMPMTTRRWAQRLVGLSQRWMATDG
jgi:lipopolysaccharide export system permease protein